MISTVEGDEQYDAVRRDMLFKANVPGRRPSVIVRAHDERDVAEALRVAAEQGLRVVCRTTGHNTAGAVLRDGGMLLDLSPLDAVEIDPVDRVATVQPAATHRTLMNALAEHDLGFPVGDCDSVALAGYVLGGGLGKNSNHWCKGFCSNALLSADVVLASGRTVTVDDERHPDIFWAMRGCGPAFFGVIISMRLQLFDPIRAVVRNRYRFPLDALSEVLGIFDDGLATRDDRVGISVGFLPDPASPDGLVVDVVMQCFSLSNSGPEREASATLERHVPPELRRVMLAADEGIELQLADLVLSYPRSNRTALDNVFTDDSESLLDMIDLVKRAPAGTVADIRLGHDVLHYPNDAKGCISPSGRHFLNCVIDWEDPVLDDTAANWVADFAELAAPHARGGYINQIDNERNPGRVRGCFTDHTWERLARIRDEHDPHGRFFSYLDTSSKDQP